MARDYIPRNDEAMVINTDMNITFAPQFANLNQVGLDGRENS
jgi:hypothetical protein